MHNSTAKNYAVYGDSTVNNQMCQKYFAMSQCSPARGQPFEIGNDQINSLLDNQHNAKHEIANIPKICKSSILIPYALV